MSTGVWDGMLAREERENDPGWAFEEWKKHANKYSYGRVGRESFAAGVLWVLKQQMKWETLSSREAIRELRKAETSIFYPLFVDDPRVWVDCPRDGRVVVGIEGYCDHCTFEFDR